MLNSGLFMLVLLLLLLYYWQLFWFFGLYIHRRKSEKTPKNITSYYILCNSKIHSDKIEIICKKYFVKHKWKLFCFTKVFCKFRTRFTGNHVYASCRRFPMDSAYVYVYVQRMRKMNEWNRFVWMNEAIWKEKSCSLNYYLLRYLI